MKLGFWELIVIFGIIFILFGRRKLPALGRAIRKTTDEFKKGLNGDEIDVTEESRRASEIAKAKNKSSRN